MNAKESEPMTWAEIVVGAVTPWSGVRNTHLYEMVAEVLGVERLSRNQRAKVRQTCQRLRAAGIIVTVRDGMSLSRFYSKVPACCGGIGVCGTCDLRIAYRCRKRFHDERRRLEGRCERCSLPVAIGSRCIWHVVENRERCARWRAFQRGAL